MTKMMHFSVKLLAVGAVTSSLSVAVLADTIVYNNTVNSLGQVLSATSLSSSSTEFGDQITLSGSDRYVTSIKLDLYDSHSSSGNEVLKTFKLYANDGPGGAPGTLLFDVMGTNTVTVPRGYNNVSFDGFAVKVPNNFTYAVSFTGIDAGETAGLLLADPPTVGSSFADYWEKVGSTWTLKALPGTPYNFSAEFFASAVPEPATIHLMALAGFGWIGMMVRRFLAKRS
jgi:hypothetical protein